MQEHESPDTLAAADEQIVTSDQFRFVHFDDPEQYFGNDPRPLRVIESRPRTRTYFNVVYTPSIPWQDSRFGCLYDSDLKRIDDSCVWVGRHDECLSEEPLVYRGDTSNLPTYDPPTIYLGFLNNHFGHFVLQTMGHWWSLIDTFPPETKFLIHAHSKALLDHIVIRDGLAFAGIDPRRLVFFDQPTRIRHVVVPQTAVQLQSHFHMVYRDFLQNRVTEMGLPPGNESEQPLYVSRRLLERGVIKYLGEDKLEAYLISKGVRVIHPQQLPFKEQIRLFNKHRRIMGIHGSGMQTITFSPSPKTVTYFARWGIDQTSFIFSRCFESDATYIQSCIRTGRLRSLLHKSKARRTGFVRSLLLDHERVIDWLETYGDL